MARRTMLAVAVALGAIALVLVAFVLHDLAAAPPESAPAVAPQAPITVAAPPVPSAAPTPPVAEPPPVPVAAPPPPAPAAAPAPVEEGALEPASIDAGPRVTPQPNPAAIAPSTLPPGVNRILTSPPPHDTAR